MKKIVRKVLLMALAATGCGGTGGTTVIEDLAGTPGRCVFMYPNSPTQTYENVVAAELQAFNDEAIILTFTDGTQATINGFGSVHCYPYEHAPEIDGV